MELTKFCMDFVWIIMVLGMDFLLELGVRVKEYEYLLGV